MSKYIKLEDAIEQVKTEFYGGGYQEWLEISIDNLINRIANLPTIEVSEEELRKKYKDFYEQGKFDALLEVSEDAISREYMLEQVRKAEEDNGGTFETDSEKVRIVIEHAPSVVPSRAEGEWIKQFNGCKCICSLCGYSNGRKSNDNYCPNCGAKMKGEEK